MIKIVHALFLLYADGIPIKKDGETRQNFIVDDDSHIWELVELLLCEEGFQVYEVSDGVKASKNIGIHPRRHGYSRYHDAK